MRYAAAILFLMVSFMTMQAEEKWQLVWADEFEKDGLPDPTKWDYEEGFVRNEEKQYYTRARLENARVENGLLIIEGRKEQFPNKAYKPGATSWKQKEQFASYTGASLITLNKASWQYGRIEVRAKLPRGKGVWPAIWMLGTDRQKIGWPRCGEIDIMEFVGHDPNRIHGTMHFFQKEKHSSKGGKITTPAPYDDFHIYSIEWTPETISVFFDKEKYFTFQVEEATVNGFNPFRNPQYLLLNLALGGSWGKEIDDSILPQRYLIDYVRVYRDVTLPKAEASPATK